MSDLDSVHINFSEHGLLVLNIILAFILFGISLELNKEDFIALLRNKKSAAIGLLSHFVILPLLTFLLVIIVHPSPSVALGMILVGACPGGNMSNMLTHFSKGNTALAVGLTSVSHLLAIILTPFNFSFYGSMYTPAADILREIHLDYREVFNTVIFIIGVPLAAGLSLRYFFPHVALRITHFMKRLSMIAFFVFLLAAFVANTKIFVAHATAIVPLVMLHNAIALAAGFYLARFLRLPFRDCKTIAFETGVQNCGLGLLLIFTFFNGLGGMAIVAATWGLWHLISGGALSFVWSKMKDGEITQ